MSKLTNKPLNKLTKKTALSVLMMSSILTGCAGVQTSVKKGDSTLFQVGDTVVTKQQIYDTVKYNKGASYSIEKIKEKIEKIEVKMKTKLRKELTSYTSNMKNMVQEKMEKKKVLKARLKTLDIKM